MLVDNTVNLDTRALIKWHFSEPCSNEVQAFLTGDVHYRLLAEREFATQLAEGFFRHANIKRQVFDLARAN